MSNQIPNSQTIVYGKNILPIKRVEIFSDEEWELFIEEWLDIKKSSYLEVERMGGAGDKGSDVAAYITDNKKPAYKWDCYQCKHYANPLSPSQIWVEIAKIIYYTFDGAYPPPQKYYFVAPKGCGTTLSTLLRTPAKLKAELKQNWPQYCEEKITSIKKVPLAGSLLAHFESFDFSVFEKIATKTIIEDHRAHPNHLILFGGGLAPRTELTPSMIPSTIQPEESKYVTQLLTAYESDANSKFTEVSMLTSLYSGHFKRARLNFHYAEQLRNLYRDSLPKGTYEKFQEEIFDGIVNTYENKHVNAFEKVKAVENQAIGIVIASNPLKDVSVLKDKVGVCHQLCNEDKLRWTEK